MVVLQSVHCGRADVLKWLLASRTPDWYDVDQLARLFCDALDPSKVCVFELCFNPLVMQVYLFTTDLQSTNDYANVIEWLANAIRSISIGVSIAHHSI